MHKPLVSIITPSYNQGKFIRYTIESVLNQTYKNIEYIIVDGGSSDNTLEILKEYKDRIDWVSESDNGQSDAINKGFKKAKGEIVAWLNSDDVYELDAVENVVNFLNENGKIDMVYGEGYIINDKNEKITSFEPTQKFDLWVLTYFWDNIMQPTTFFKREALENCGFLDVNLNWCMDWDLWIKFGLNYEVAYLGKYLACSREYGDTKTSTGGLKRYRELVALMRKYCVTKYPPGCQAYMHMYLNNILSNHALLNRCFGGIINKRHKILMLKYLTLYPDGWVGKNIFIAINNTKKCALIKGQVIFEKSLPLKISVYHKKEVIDTITINELGDFKINIEFPKVCINEKVDFIRLEMNNTIKPSSLLENNDDDRNLSFKLVDILLK